METRILIGFILIGVGIIDYLIGSCLVIPRVKVEDAKSKLRLAFAASSLLTIALGISFLGGWIGLAA